MTHLSIPLYRLLRWVKIQRKSGSILLDNQQLIMQNKLFLKAADVCQLLEVSTTSAYEIIANLNSELEKKGYLVLKGKVPTKYFVERFYGIEDVCQIPQEKGVEWFHA